MKKLRKLLPTFIALMMAIVLAFSLSGCGSCNAGPDEPGPEPTPEVTIVGIEAAISGVKREYYLEQDVSTDGLLVYCNYSDKSREDVTSKCAIDTSAYNKSTAGKYEIKISYTTGGQTYNTSYEVEVAPLAGAVMSAIAINTDKVKQVFKVGEEFTSAGLEITATLSSDNIHYDVPVSATDKDVEIDSSNFNKDVPGEYEIYVSYTRDGVTRNTSYMVAVNSVIEGVHGIELVKDKTSFNLNDETFTLEDVHVYEVGDEGIVKDKDTGEITNTEITEGLTFTYYKEGVLLETTDNIKSTGGTYQIGVAKDYVVGDETYVMRDFVTFYVVNGLKTLALKSGTTTQQAGREDLMTADWLFTLTYQDDSTKELNATQVTIEDLNTTSAGSFEATVTYSEVIGGEKQTVTVKVSYTIEAKPVTGGSVTVEANITDLVSDGTLTANNTATTQDIVLASDSGVTITAIKGISVDQNNKSLNGKSFTHRLKLNGAGDMTKQSIKFELPAAATITVYGITSSSSALDRTLSLYGDTGALIDGSTTAGFPNAITEVKFEATAAGTYYIWGSAAINIYYIMVETEGSAPAVSEVEANITDLVGDGTLTANNTATTQDIVLASDSGVTITAIKGISVDQNNKSLNGKSFTHRLKLNGAGDMTKQSIKFELPAAATITVYGITSSSSALDRTLSLYDSTGALVEGSTTAGFPNAITEVTFEATAAGTYYIWGSAAINIYYIKVA